MPGYRRYGRHFGRRGPHLDGAIWIIGIGVMMLWGHWWPGILVLIGISMVLQAVFRGQGDNSLSDMGQQTPLPPASPPPSTPPVAFNPPYQPEPVPAPTANEHPVDLLPSVCPQCGGPVRANDVKWNGRKSASCAFCGSTLPMKKNN